MIFRLAVHPARTVDATRFGQADEVAYSCPDSTAGCAGAEVNQTPMPATTASPKNAMPCLVWPIEKYTTATTIETTTTARAAMVSGRTWTLRDVDIVATLGDT
jgi:hypothetical protein